ncbi:Hypothetical protein, putative [Bodo saltans]|uniref:Uncharacterized protein n=1 Tax=Bodo saltans TaxID=75058 RepID=A0A0S4JV71_BODSA|nr:Hypothetical protein, putative [Bodo saltans]|eukprot:CUG94473.1 Hypothetical protein, putative [Bodo saltans]
MSSGTASSERAVAAQISRVQEDLKKVEAIQRRLRDDEAKLRALIAQEELSKGSSTSAPLLAQNSDLPPVVGNIQEEKWK